MLHASLNRHRNTVERKISRTIILATVPGSTTHNEEGN